MTKSMQRRRPGYTLIEMAIVLSVVGVLTASGITAYRTWLQGAAAGATAKNMDMVMDAVSAFLVQHGRYPCAAQPDAERTDPMYGQEMACAGAGVIRGAVPFRVLNLPETLAEDGYRNRLQYVVTKRLAVSSTYARTGGEIGVVDGGTPSQSVVTPANSVHFIVFSTGEDGAGAYTHEGKEPFPCTVPGPPELDDENCDGGLADSSYRFAPMAPAAGAKHFDDMIRISSSAVEPMWMATDTSGMNIHDTGLAVALGIGLTPTSSVVKLDVGGNMRASGSVRSDRVCESDGTACFEAEKIAEPFPGRPEMNCPKATDPITHVYAHKIANGQIECRPEVPFTCPPGEVLLSVNIITGLPVCGNGAFAPPFFNPATPPVPLPPPPPPPPVPLVNGTCGAANGVAVLSAPIVGLCATGTPTAVVGSGPWTWTCTGSGPGFSNQACSAPLTPALGVVCGPQGTSYHQATYVNGQTVQEHIITLTSIGSIGVGGITSVCSSSPTLFNNHPSYFELLANTGPSLSDPVNTLVGIMGSLWVENSGAYTAPVNPYCPPGSWSVSEFSHLFDPLSPGSYRIRLVTTNPSPCSSTSECAAGISATVCQEGGPSAGSLNGVCGPAFALLATPPTGPVVSDLCTQGTASAVTGDGYIWRWTCNGVGPGTSTADCSAWDPPLVNGTCGVADGVAAPSAPIAGLCASGLPTAVAGSGPWTWTCNGGGAGFTNQACSAPALTCGLTVPGYHLTF